jgi:hypothetical protein
MPNLFTYSILRYHHSLAAGESMNVALLFAFENDERFYLIPGNTRRVSAAYPEFDPGLFSIVLKHINYMIASRIKAGLFPEENVLTGNTLNYLLPEDSSSFQFSAVFTVVNVFATVNEAIRDLCRILLPDYNLAKEDRRHDEAFLLKKYTDEVGRRNINVNLRLRRDYPVHIKGVKLNFEYSWKNGTTHLVKPLSFDLKGASDIVYKSVAWFGYFDLLADYAHRQEYNFDLLVAKPQDIKLQEPYEEAIFNLNRTKAPKSIITEEGLEAYSEETANILHSKDL